ncbi:MAG: DUF4293 domain-containing protein [Saprospiraceae bacterium]|nr:DUF4293 domain-containing protein [Saprospiraceae bacterium]
MIQRIQTIYLFLAGACGFGVLALPFAATPTTVQSSALFADATFSIGDNIGLLVLFAVAGALAIASIFLYNNRAVQVKISWVALVANILGALFAGFLLWQDQPQLAGQAIAPGISAFMPLAFVVFAALAIKGVKKDEAIVKSADRLR